MAAAGAEAGAAVATPHLKRTAAKFSSKASHRCSFVYLFSAVKSLARLFRLLAKNSLKKKLIYSFVTLTFKFCSLSCVGLLTTNYLDYLTHVTYNSPKRSTFLLCNV